MFFLALVWWCKGVDVVGQASLLRGAAQRPPLPLLYRLSSSFCLCHLQTLLLRVFVCTHCVFSCFSPLQAWDRCVCVCVSAYVLWAQLLPEATMHMYVCVSSTVWSHSRLQQYWAPRPASSAGVTRNKCGRSCPLPHPLHPHNTSGPHVSYTIWLKLIRSLGGVNFFPQLTAAWACVFTEWQWFWYLSYFCSNVQGVAYILEWMCTIPWVIFLNTSSGKTSATLVL